MFDFHTHVLPGVDDGAKDQEESLALLKAMKEQGVTAVMATPHFYAAYDTIEDYKTRTETAFSALCKIAEKQGLPPLVLGSEVLYYRYIGNSESIENFCLNHSRYLLLELTNDCIDSLLLEDIRLLMNDRHIIPIIAHVERYRHAPGYKKLLQYLKENEIATQINASSLLIRSEARFIRKLMKEDLVTYLASDAHSIAERPPQMKQALAVIAEKMGQEQADRLVQNGLDLWDELRTGATI
ncbi:MAG: hypothetical protein IJT66_00695 [Clostridia bacterium]|nr:hypothetical protein [Clostridia bacterium]